MSEENISDDELTALFGDDEESDEELYDNIMAVGELGDHI